MAKTNKRVVVTKLDPNADATENLSLDEVEIQKPGKGETLVEMILRPINPVDSLCIQGKFKASFDPDKFPAVPGFEGVGKVVESETFKEGQRVVGKPWPAGTWQQYFVVKDDVLEAVPDGVSDYQAASFWVNPFTCVGMLRMLSVPKGEYVLQTAAGSALGRQIIQVSKSYGLKTINVVRRSEQKQELLDMGADHVIATDKQDIAEEVAKITDGKGAYGAMDAIGGTTTNELLKSIRRWGTVIVYGFLSGDTINLSTSDLAFGQRTVTGYILRESTWAPLDAAGKAELVKEVFRLLSDGVICPYMGKTYPLDEVKDALKASSGVAHGGKVYLSN